MSTHFYLDLCLPVSLGYLGTNCPGWWNLKFCENVYSMLCCLLATCTSMLCQCHSPFSQPINGHVSFASRPLFLTCGLNYMSNTRLQRLIYVSPYVQNVYLKYYSYEPASCGVLTCTCLAHAGQCPHGIAHINFPEGTVYEYQFIFNGSLREPDNIHIDIFITVHNGNPAIIM